MEAASVTGLSETEAAARLERAGPRHEQATSRSYASIAIANTFTVFNAILAGFGIATIVFGNPKDALFLGILIANVAIGTFQEVRAKRALDKLSALVVAKATVVRDGEPRQVAVEEVVVGDLVRIASGDQIPADGRLVHADGLALDESELTGESEPVVRTGRRRGALGLLRGRGRGRLRDHGGRRREPRRPGDRDRAPLPPPALAAGAGDGPPADRDGRADGAARDRPRGLAGAARRRASPTRCRRSPPGSSTSSPRG